MKRKKKRIYRSARARARKTCRPSATRLSSGKRRRRVRKIRTVGWRGEMNMNGGRTQTAD